MTDPLLLEEMIRFQLAWLDAYERLLARYPWNEAALNETLKTLMQSWLPLLRAQCSLGEQLFAAHKDLIGQYRRALETVLAQRRDAPP